MSASRTKPASTTRRRLRLLRRAGSITPSRDANRWTRCARTRSEAAGAEEPISTAATAKAQELVQNVSRPAASSRSSPASIGVEKRDPAGFVRSVVAGRDFGRDQAACCRRRTVSNARRRREPWVVPRAHRCHGAADRHGFARGEEPEVYDAPARATDAQVRNMRRKSNPSSVPVSIRSPPDRCRARTCSIPEVGTVFRAQSDRALLI